MLRVCGNVRVEDLMGSTEFMDHDSQMLDHAVNKQHKDNVALNYFIKSYEHAYEMKVVLYFAKASLLASWASVNFSLNKFASK